jgi:hypothetical protein
VCNKTITGDEGLEVTMYSSNVAEYILMENTHIKEQPVYNY